MANRKNIKLAIGGAALATILAGLGAAGAIAASDAWSPGEERKAIIDDVAGQLGVEPDALSSALKQALKNRIDAAVEAGRLTEAQAKVLKERIDSGDGVPFFGGFGRPGPLGGHFGHHGHLGQARVLETAADYLGLTQAELREQLRDKTLAEIAKDKSKPVAGLVQALVTSARKAIDEAVADGRLTQEQATELERNLESRTEDLVNGEFRRPLRGFRHGFRLDDASPRAPPFFWGPRA